jgi:drug/metabolite transporter (DMT)-like permease
MPGARRPSWNVFAGAGLAFAGIVLLTAPSATGHGAGLAGLLPDLSSINMGDLLTLGCAVGFAFHCLALSHISPRIGFQPLALLQVGFCALFMAISLPFIEHPQVAWTPRLLLALAVAAVLATAAAFSVQSWVQSVLPPTHTALILTMEPVFAWITSFLFMGERLGLRPGLGALLILTGIVLTEALTQPHLPTAHEA